MDRYFFKGSQFEIAEENIRLREEVARTEKLKSVATLASGMAHEIKNPLTAIKTFTEHLPKKLNDKKFLNNFSRIVGNEVDRIDHIVHELLDFAKPSQLEMSQTNIHEVLEDTLTMLNNQTVKNHIHVKTNYYKDKNISLNIDRRQIRQALHNILLNSIESMPKGGELLVETSIIKTDDDPQKKYFQIAIEDTGGGIKREDLDHIFDPFYTKKDEGTGLGLPITHSIIEKHNGRISVESYKHDGVRFMIELPMDAK